MFGIMSLLLVTNLLVSHAFILPNPSTDGNIVTSSTQSTTETVIENTVSADSTTEMQSMAKNALETIENSELNATLKDVDSPLENMVEEAIQESMQNVENTQTTIDNVSSAETQLNVLENMTEMDSLQPSMVENYTENVLPEMETLSSTSSSVTTSVMENYLTEQEIVEDIEQMQSPVPTIEYPMDTLSSTQDIESEIEYMASSPPSMTDLQEVAELESLPQNTLNLILPSIPSNMKNFDQLSLSPITENLSPNLLNYPSNKPTILTSSTESFPSKVPTIQELESKINEYSPPLMETMPVVENMPPLMPYFSNMGSSSPMTSTIEELESEINEHSSPLMNTVPLMLYSSNMGSPSPMTPTIEELESEINKYSSPLINTMPDTESMTSPPLMNTMPLMPYSSNMGSSSPMTTIEELESEITKYSSPLLNTMPDTESMTSPPLMNTMPLMPYSSNMGPSSNTTPTIEELESEINEYSSPLMNTMPDIESLTSPTPQPPNMETELESLISEYTSPLMETMPNMENMTPPLMTGFSPSITPTIQDLESQIGGYRPPPTQPMANIENILPPTQRPPAMEKYSPNSGSVESRLPPEDLSQSNSNFMGGFFGLPNELPFVNTVFSPLQNLPFFNRLSPSMGNAPTMQQPSAPMQPNRQLSNGDGWTSPFSLVMSNNKFTPNAVRPPSMADAEMSSLNALISRNSELSSWQKDRFLKQMSNLGPASLRVMRGIGGMMRDEWQLRLRQKMEKIKAAEEELRLAAEAAMVGDEREMRQRVSSAISILGNSPISTALQFALNQDGSMLPLIVNISRTILDEVQ